MNVHVILNPAGGALQGGTEQQVLASFERYKQVRCTVHLSRDPADIPKLVSEALEDSANIVVAGGGDGTISSLVNMIAMKDVTLGVLPLGSRNHLARDLNIPLEVDGAIDAICAGKTISMDLGEVNGRFFVNNVSVGAYPKAVYIRDKWRPYIGKWPAMILAALFMLFAFPWFPIRLEWDGQVRRRLVPLLLVGNNPYSTTWPDLGRRPVLDSGMLWMVLLRKMGVLKRLWLVALTLLGKMDHLSEVEVEQATKLTLRSHRRRIAIGIDGERIKQNTPLIFILHPGALKVRAPRE